jgi:hypothetical protein
VVTGVSVGALEAPFAFLGPTYDTTLRALFTRLATADLFREEPGLVAYFSDSLAPAQPLASLINEFVDEPLVRAIAAEHGKGRRLFVGTTHVYAGRPMIWDIGAIAASGKPGALDLIRHVLLASAPGSISMSLQTTVTIRKCTSTAASRERPSLARPVLTGMLRRGSSALGTVFSSMSSATAGPGAST